MKVLTVIAYVTVTALAAVGVVMAKNNPGQTEYEEYAAQEVEDYLKSSVCKKAQGLLDNFIQANCKDLVGKAGPRMRDVISLNTERYDFVVFSIYRTDFKFHAMLPGYRFESVGAFGQFYIYNAEQL